MKSELSERATRIAKERNISFGEALPLARRESAAANQGAPVLVVSSASVGLTRWAEKVAKERNISFCEALPIARREINFASDIVEPAEIARTVQSALRGSLGKALDGQNEKLITATDVFQAMAALSAALDALGIGVLAKPITEAVEGILETITNESGEGIIGAAAVEAIIAQAADSALQVYSQNIDELRGDSGDTQQRNTGSSADQGARRLGPSQLGPSGLSPSGLGRSGLGPSGVGSRGVQPGSSLAEQRRRMVKELETQIEELPTRFMSELRKNGFNGNIADAHLQIHVARENLLDKLKALKAQIL